MANVLPNSFSGALAESVHRMTTNDPRRDDRAQQSDADVRVRSMNRSDVLGDALIGVVGRIAQELHPVMIGAGEPVIEIFPRHPPAPSDLKPLIEIELVDGKQI